MNKKPSENLSDILYRFIILHERLVEEKEGLENLWSRLDTSVEQFDEDVEKFKKFKNKLEIDVTNKLEKVSKNILSDIENKITVIANEHKNINGMIADFKRTINTATVELNRIQADRNIVKITNLLFMVIVCAFVSIIIYKVIVPAPMIALGEKELETYYKGQFVQALPKSEQDRIFYSHKTKPAVMQGKKKKNEGNEHNNENGENREINSETSEMRY